MNPLELIARKRDGQAHSAAEIESLVRGYVDDKIPDYQMSAWLMAAYLRGLSIDETVALTTAMLNSGSKLDDDVARRVDKHSTGGIGDKTSFIVAPLLACCGLQVPMISGRGLGPTGGTLDKLESIPGCRTDLSGGEISRVLNEVGCVITGATSQLVPADRKLYALRDATSTIGSIGLITASILSKKLAENLSALVLDVKFGSGTFMKTRSQARALADSLLEVAGRLGLPSTALVTAMDQPNGRMVGSAVEIDEALEVLGGNGPSDLRELAVALAGEVLLMKRMAGDAAEAQTTLAGYLDSGRAMARFEQMVAAQGGDLRAPRPCSESWPLVAQRDGWIVRIDAERLGLAVVEMGGGRKTVGQPIDHAVGLEMLVRLGDRVQVGQPLLNIFASPEARRRALEILNGCITIDQRVSQVGPLIAERIVAPPKPQLAKSAAMSPSEQALIDAAIAARDRAYAPYSRFRVGAAILSASGKIYAGSNVENASYGLTICAERAAIVAAVADGDTKFSMLAVATEGGGSPCGACRQFAAEFCPDLPILIVDAANPSGTARTTLAELLPRRFELGRS